MTQSPRPRILNGQPDVDTNHFRAQVMRDGVTPFLCHVVGSGRHFVHLLGDETGIQLARERVVPGAPLGTLRLLQTLGS
jgi:hypothetical protein